MVAGFFSCRSSKKSRSSILVLPCWSCLSKTIPERRPLHTRLTIHRIDYNQLLQVYDRRCYGNMDTTIPRPMPRKKKQKRFRAVTAVKELARERVGSPPSGKIVVEKKKKPEKYKPTLGKLLEPE
jgi:hypothetical protein